MIDLLISYINFVIIGIKYIVKLIAFQPPNPKGYRIKNKENEVLESINLNQENSIEILFIVPNKPKEIQNNNNDKNGKNGKNNKKNSTKQIDNKNKIIDNKNRKLEYRPAPNRYANFELLYFTNNDNNTKIPAFLFKPKDFFKELVKDYLIIYCHGNSGDIGTSFMECQFLSRHILCNVLCFEYPGYGLSNDINNTNEKRSYFNLRQAYKFARDNLKYSPENIFIYGFSLGTGIAFDIACDKNYPCGGIILQSPFLSIIRTIYNFKKTYYFDLFNNCDKARLCNSKIFFIHGDKDTIVPYIHGRILAKLIPKNYFCGFYTVNGANHNDILKFAKEEIYKQIQNFIDECNNSKIKKSEKKDSEYDMDLSSYKYLNNNSYDIKKKEYEKKLDIDINSMNNNITSNEELNKLKNDYNKNNNNYNIPPESKNANLKETKGDNTTGEEVKNNRSDIFNENDDDISFDNRNVIEARDININMNYYNINAKNNDLNTLNSKSNSQNYKNEFTININNDKEESKDYNNYYNINNENNKKE